VARRAFLRGCGATTLLLPLLRSIEARAQGIKPPLRFMVIHHPLGTQIDQWRPAAAATTTNFTLPFISAPFAPLQSKMVMIDGVNLIATTQVAGGPNGDRTHESGMVALMTGVPTLGRIGQQDHAAGGPSIDQILLQQSPVLGGPSTTKPTPFGSLQLAADVRSDRDEVSPRVLSYLAPDALPSGLPTSGAQFEAAINAARKPLSPETQPLNVYNRIFAGSITSENVLAQQKSVLDYMNSDLARMRRLIPASETSKLDMFATSIQQLEASLMGSTCTKPDQPPSFVMSGTGASGSSAPASGMSALSGVDYYDPSDPNNHPHQTLGRLQLEMIRVAFVCDLVRVATFMWSAGTNWVVYPATFQGASFSSTAQPHHPPSHTTAVATLQWLAQIDQFYATQNSQFIQQLDATKDIDGSSLLDNTVVAYVTEVGRAYDHDWRNVPFLVFGGKNTGIQGGTYLKVSDGKLAAVEGTYGGTGPNRPTNDVWLALAPIFGVNLPSLGDMSKGQYQGPLPGLVGPVSGG
jgi:hypothetical protein